MSATTGTRAVLRYEVPVDDQWHEIETDGNVVHVASRGSGVVEFWTAPGMYEHIDERHIDERARRWLRVYATGQPVAGAYVGTTFDAATPSLVWHLFVSDVPR